MKYYIKFVMIKMKKLSEIGNCFDILPIVYILLVVIYMICSIKFYIEDKYINDNVLHGVSQPTVLYAIKWCYSFLLICCITQLRGKPFFSWIILNVISVNILLLHIVVINGIPFYSSVFDKLYLELIALLMLITVNLKSFAAQYRIVKKNIYLLYIAVASFISTVFIYIAINLFD